MSLESYLKTIQHNQDTKSINSVAGNKNPNDAIPKVLEETKVSPSKLKKTGFGKLIFTLIIISFFLLAAIKNPNKTEAKAEIMTMLMEQLNTKMQENTDSPASKYVTSFAMSLMGNTLVNALVNTEVSDYIFFSTYDVKINVPEGNKSIVSGIIVFGKLIPLYNDLDGI